MGGKNDGKEAERGFLAVFERRGAVIERFYDQADLRGRNGGKAVGDFPKPADFLVTYDGLLHYAEVKSTTSKTSFSFHCIRPAQSSAALRQARVGGPYVFYIYAYETATWYVMSCSDYARALQEGRASLKFSELKQWQI